MDDTASLLTGLRVLVVDDVGFSVLLVSRMLREMGCGEIITANGGAQALTYLQGARAGAVDLVILDYHMPDLKGTMVARSIREGRTAVPKDLPIVMLTGDGDAAIVREAFHLRIDDYLVKPISKAVLGRRVLQALSNLPVQRRLEFASEFRVSPAKTGKI